MAAANDYLTSEQGFIPKFSSTIQTISSGVTGTLVTLTPPAGQKVRLDHVAASAGTVSGITITRGVDTVVSVKTLVTATATILVNDQFAIGGVTTAVLPIPSKKDEIIVISKDAGNTAQDIKYSYSFGE